MNTRKKVLVVGTGAGGATIANKLQDNYDVTILEAGKEFHPFSAPLDAFASLRKTGLFLDERMIRLLLPNMQVRKSRGDGMVMDESGAGQRTGMTNDLDLGGDNGMVMVNGLGVGGTTTLATGNAVRCDAALKSLGIDLDAEFEQLCRELPITTEHEKYWNPATRQLFSIFDNLGFEPQATPKFLTKPQCANCGHCAIGCPTSLKWDTRALIQKAVEKGARLITGCRVENLLIKDGAVTEVRAKKGLTSVSFPADLVVLAAGGFGTPVILENSGIACDRTLFVDPVLCVAGIKKNFGQDKQLLMPFFSARDGYMLSPYMDYLSFFFNKDWRYPMKDIVSVMIKLADESGGYTDAKGIHKGLTQPDEALLLRAVEDCYAVLEGLGISRKDAFLGTVNAGHPGGCLPLTRETAATLHDSRLPDNLYVADGSLLPKALGMPPILTIMAMAMKVAEKM